MKPFINYIAVLSLSLLNFGEVFCQDHTNARVIAKVVDNFVDIKGVAQNNDATFKDDYSYLLFSLKTDINGNYSRNSQSGVFSLQPGEEKQLSTIKVSIQKGEEFKVYLFLRKDGVLISKDSAMIYAAEKKTTAKKINESEFEIKGIVIDDVITKIGKDFYDYFYQEYSNSGNQYPFVINIKEKPYFGYSSIINIEIEDQNVFEFFSKPEEDYLRANVEAALQNINQFAIQRKLLFRNTRI